MPAWTRKFGIRGFFLAVLLFLTGQAIWAIYEKEVQDWWEKTLKPALALSIPLWLVVVLVAAGIAVVFLIKRSSSAVVFYSRNDIPRFEPRLEHGEDIWVLGITLRGLRIAYWDHFLDALDQGKRFRFLLVDPDNASAVNVLTANNPTFHEASMGRKILLESIECFKLLATESTSRKGAVEIRLLSSVPLCSMIIVDGNKPDGNLTVEMYGYQVAPGKRLGFELTRSKHPQIFDFFLGQFHKMWDAAKPPNIQEL